MKLQKAFEIVPGDVVAFIGAGGKTSTLIALGHELAQAGLRVLATTTTHISVDELDLMPYSTTFDAGVAHLSLALGENRFVFPVQQYSEQPGLWARREADSPVTGCCRFRRDADRGRSIGRTAAQSTVFRRAEHPF